MASRETENAITADEWAGRQAEYHRRKLALWEKGLSGDRFTRACQSLRITLGLKPVESVES